MKTKKLVFISPKALLKKEYEDCPLETALDGQRIDKKGNSTTQLTGLSDN